MSKNAILFIDLLGVQKMWKQGGANAVKERIEQFNEFIVEQTNYLPSSVHRDAEYTLLLSGDSASFMCQDYQQAIEMGIHFFQQAFYATGRYGKALWLRGAISQWGNQYFPFNTEPIQSKDIQVGTKYVLEDDYLGVLALEKSGFRGMRLIIDKALLSCFGRSFTRRWEGFHSDIGIVTTLRECTYPREGDFADIIWMAGATQERYDHLKGIMSSRFKGSVHDVDEFAQASWTRVVFDQVDSIIWSCKNRKPGDDLINQSSPKDIKAPQYRKKT
ncbi:hypothetical protein [Thiolapillus sp.]